MNGVAYGLIGAAKVACNRGGGLALGTGEEYLTTTDRTGGRGPEPGLQGSPLVRRERAHKSGCLHTQEYTICPKTSIGSALGRCRGNSLGDSAVEKAPRPSWLPVHLQI